MSSSRRVEKLNELMREELSKIIDRDLEFPASNMLTITRVDISPDVHYADVMVSILGPNPRDVMAILHKNIYNTQQKLNKKIRRRPVPAIRYKLDREEFQREKIEKKLAEIKREEDL